MSAKGRRPGQPPKYPPKLSSTVLQRVLPASIDPIVRQGKRPDGVRFQSHTVQRTMESKAFAAEAEGAGWAFDVPAPDPGSRLLWVEISTPWQFWEWSSSWGNDSSNDVRIDGSVDWLWNLGANPNFFSGYLLSFMGGNGHFTFYTLVPPGNAGFDVGWLADPDDQTFTNYSPVPNQPTGLSDLLSTQVGDALRLWFSLDVFNPEINGSTWYGPGWFNGGTQSLNVVYAYSGPPRPVPDFGGLLFEA